MKRYIEPHHPTHTPDQCAACDTLARPHGVTFVVEGFGEFCSRRCYQSWSGETWAQLLCLECDSEASIWDERRTAYMCPQHAPILSTA